MAAILIIMVYIGAIVPAPEPVKSEVTAVVIVEIY